MNKSFSVWKKYCRSIFIALGLFVFFAATQTVHAAGEWIDVTDDAWWPSSPNAFFIDGTGWGYGGADPFSMPMYFDVGSSTSLVGERPTKIRFTHSSIPGGTGVQVTSTDGATLASSGSYTSNSELNLTYPETGVQDIDRITLTAFIMNPGEIYVTKIELYFEPQDITIPDPEPIDIQGTVDDGQVTIENGTIDNTNQVTTQVNVTITSNNGEAIFPTGTIITEENNGSFNFENLTISDATVENAVVAVELGIPGTNLSFSQDVTVTLNVGTEYNDQTLQIYSQSVGQTDWSDQGSCTVIEGNCIFTTNHATTYAVGGNPAQEPIQINVEVQDTLSLDCYETGQGSGDHIVTLSDTTTGTGYVVAGIPSIGKSTCDATTNDDQGYYLTIENSSTAGSTGNVLEHEDPNIPGQWYAIPDTQNGLTYFDGTTTSTQTWTDTTTKGLGFSVISFPDTNTTNNTTDESWTLTGTLCQDGTTGGDIAEYAAVPSSPQTISAVTQYEANTTTTDICYKVDVLPSQQSGQYTGQVTFTAVTDASTYLN